MPPPASLHAEPLESVAAVEAALGRITETIDQTERLATLGTLAAGICHEVGNILTPVLAYAQLALANPEDHELHTKALHKVVIGVETATRIAESILGFAGSNDSAECDVSQVVHSAMDCIARDPNKDRINVKIDVQPGTIVRMNPLNLQQVLINLLLNARAAMLTDRPAGDHRLTVAAITRADGTIGIRVTDTGPGIAPEIAGRIFEPFVTTKRNGKGATGSGLGLSICRKLVELAGGTITATSAPNRGTTFLIVLPSPKSNRAKAI